MKRGEVLRYTWISPRSSSLVWVCATVKYRIGLVLRRIDETQFNSWQNWACG